MRTKKYILNKLFTVLVLLVIIMIFTLLTNPESVPLPLLILPFLLLGFVLYLLAMIVMAVVGKANSASARLTSISIASFGVLILLLQSLNQLTWKDGMISIVFAVFFWLYIWRADFLRK